MVARVGLLLAEVGEGLTVGVDVDVLGQVPLQGFPLVGVGVVQERDGIGVLDAQLALDGGEGLLAGVVLRHLKLFPRLR